MTTRELRFPEDFRWGAATASYQIEGAVHEDGRGESIWDRFSHTPGKVENGDTGDVADDHYRRYREDIDIMRELGLQTYRFSIAWPRILPEGHGRVEQRGLDFYDRLVDELLTAGIEPFVTLYHWDLPQHLEDEGGWPSRDMVDRFADYTEVVARRLGDRIKSWITINEPWVVAWLGYGWGVMAPGRKSDAEALATCHHLLLAHGRAVEVLRRESPRSQVGITLNLTPHYPASDTPEDRRAAHIEDGTLNRWFLDPIYHGAYPQDIVELFQASMPAIRPGDMETISMPIDFLGINNYSRHVVRMNPDTGKPEIIRPEGSTYTEMGWEVAPDSIRDLLVRVHRDYRPARIYITENGAAFHDVLGSDGRVHDPERQQYLESYLDAIRRAVEQGAPVAGYFVWSLLDNFEWGHGYTKRFGIVYVDYATQQRVIKDSARWYRSFVAQQPAPSPVGRG
jgi:beta-glucosidase